MYAVSVAQCKIVEEKESEQENKIIVVMEKYVCVHCIERDASFIFIVFFIYLPGIKYLIFHDIDMSVYFLTSHFIKIP